MRMGKPIERSLDTGVLRPDMPGAAKAKIKYALLGSALPLAVLLGSTLARKRRASTRVTSQGVTGASGPSADLDQHIELPRGRPVVRFRVRELIDHIEQSGRAYIVVGDFDCALADHPKPSSLDYWLRENFAKNKDTKQATNEVITQLVVTGLFEQLDGLRCPDGGQKCKGLRLKSRVEMPPTKNSSEH
jgi:hypothetical protein